MELTDKEKAHLENITFAGLMRTVTPLQVSEKLIRLGYARKAVGGLMPTKAAHELLSKK